MWESSCKWFFNSWWYMFLEFFFHPHSALSLCIVQCTRDQKLFVQSATTAFSQCSNVGSHGKRLGSHHRVNRLQWRGRKGAQKLRSGLRANCWRMDWRGARSYGSKKLISAALAEPLVHTMLSSKTKWQFQWISWTKWPGGTLLFVAEYSDAKSRIYTSPQGRVLEDCQVLERKKTGGLAALSGSAGEQGSFGLRWSKHG